MFASLYRTKIRGFTLIELAIVMGVVGVLTAGLWRITANSNQQTKDSATAQQQLTLIAAVKGVLADPAGQSWLTSLGAGVNAGLGLPSAGNNATLALCQAFYAGATPYLLAGQAFCNYLPRGFDAGTTNPYGQIYNIRVLSGGTTANQNYSFMIMTSGTTAIPDANGGRISGLIGGDGGFLYSSTSVCGGTVNKTACGTMGAWSLDVTAAAPSSYGFGSGLAAAGHVASQSFVSSTTNSNYTWLARGVMPGDTAVPGVNTYNTMTTSMALGAGSNLYIGNNVIYGTGIAPQVNLHADYSSTTTPASPLVISNATSAYDLLSTGGCTALSNNGVFQATCPAVLYIPHGDVSVPNGEVAAQKVYSSSDIKLKKDIRPLQNSLADVMKLAPVTFTFKSSGSKSIGVIAQDVEKIYPQLVMDNGGTKYVEYNGLIAPLIGAIQELKQENDRLRAQVEDQAQRLKAVESKHQ